MKILFKSPYLSIDSLNAVDLPDFTVITGVNGSGKTHLLEGIQNKNLVIEGHEEDRSVYFNYVSFFLEDESDYNTQSFENERKNAWNFFRDRIVPTLSGLRNQWFGQDETYNKIIRIAKRKHLGIWKLTNKFFQLTDPFAQLEGYRKSVDDFFWTHDEIKNHSESQSILSLIEGSNNFADLITEEEFLESYKHVSLKQDFLPRHFGRIFFDYYIRWLNNQVILDNNKRFNRKDKALTNAQFVRSYGPKPWLIVDSILKKFKSLDYEINNPEGCNLFSTFRLTLKNKRNGASINFSNLSSGEKVLMALVASIYKLGSDSHFPSILLLDEIDASLHPSMVQNMLDVINDVFIRNGTKVILATHAPTTIALVSEKSIYVVNRQGESANRIEKYSQEMALNILTEGYVTLGEGLTLADQISKKELVIFTEGYNCDYIKKAIELLSSVDLSRIDITKEIKDISNTTQLSLYYKLFSVLPHKNNILFVWDCDFKGNPTPANNTTPYVFDRNTSNKKVRNGIENLFNPTKFKDKFYKKIEKPDGGFHTDLDKNMFREYILSEGTKRDFRNFKPLIDIIEKILGSD